ncbi:PilN domain-containing protein [Bradyrhizobium diazoefficiens]|uniref:PilN domain-containing protein n=1 Tax=Bradyrhizobium diazoefficiens TaxID=1355477 RepID=UPI00190E0264|nr:PilN domain-containing protein [Bradyrhizobium diazoefficiens]QQO17688.1 PilN domain-containing protein [Bradyrhizobium diazoefficiens]
MSVVSELTAALSLWIDAVAGVVSARLANVKPVRRIEVAEDEAGALTMRLAPSTKLADGDLSPCRLDVTDGSINGPLSPQWAAAVRGGVVELLLQPSRFVFRTIELPARAAEFLDGIIRAQIDRITPWPPSEALFHWTPPQGNVGDRIETTVVATGRAPAASLAQAFSDLGAAGVAILTGTPEHGRITVLDQRSGMQAENRRIRTALIAGFATTALLAMLSLGFGGFVADAYDAQQQLIQQRIAERRAVMRGNQTGSGGSPLDLLIRRKQGSPSSVLVIEALSALLPLDTYATEVRIEGNKLQIVGVTRDAPSLISILEQSPHFSSAGFFAPTTHAANEAGERFHIETKLKPYFGSGT